MVNMTIAVPTELKQQLENHPEINWSEVARRAWIVSLSNLEKLELLNKLTANSKATDKDIEELVRKLKHGIARRHEEKFKKYYKQKTQIFGMYSMNYSNLKRLKKHYLKYIAMKANHHHFVKRNV